ncbi:MAG TPA: transposase [Pyrinomonadaceae bacterium]|nr:transposase [Pyrinomonadaceae bacterium]
MSNEEDKHRQSVRLKGFDYAYRGFFFVTMCTHDKKPTLGKIINYESQLSDIGRVVEKCWREIPNHFSNVCLDEWVIMPNHLHEIVVIRFPLPREKQGTTCRAPTNAETIYEKFGRPVAGSLPTIIRSFKSAVTKRANELGLTDGRTVWQRNYFEHVIRTEESLHKIRNYIWENPIHWWSDEYNRGSEVLGARHAVPSYVAVTNEDTCRSVQLV